MVIELDRQQPKSGTSVAAGRNDTQVSLSTDDLKAIAEAAGFTANFEAQAIKQAYIELDGETVGTVIEIDKNAKPADVALRYAKDVWTAEENEQLKSSLRTTYTTNSSLARLRSFLNEHWQIETTKDGITIRIELKERRLSVIQSGSAEQFEPIGSQASAESPAPITNNEVQSRAMPTQPVQSERNSTESSTQEKYSTYSRSEVDRMMRQQAENITSALGGKISAQTKFFQDAIAEQEKSFNKSIDKLLVNVDEFRTKLEANVTAQQNATREQTQKFVADVTRELEQFKTSLNKSILPSVRTLDEKLSALDNKSSKKEKQSPAPAPAATPDPQSKLLLWLVGASLATSAASVVLQLVHH